MLRVGEKQWVLRILDNIDDVRSCDVDRYTRARAKDGGSDDEEARDTEMPAGRDTGEEEPSDDEFDLKEAEKPKQGNSTRHDLEILFNMMTNGNGCNDNDNADEHMQDRAYENDTHVLLKACIAKRAKRLRHPSQGDRRSAAKIRKLDPAVADEVIIKWRADVKKYKRPRRSPAPPPAERQQLPTPRDVDSPFPFVAGVIEGGVAEYAPSEPGCAWKEPSWDRKTGPPPSIEQTTHIWRLNRLQALAFHIIATAFLSYGETSDEGAPKLEAEKQLLMIINGEAGVGKSQVLRCFMWFANQHGRAEQLVVTSFQGRPVANLRNPAVKGLTSSQLACINPRSGNKPRSGNAATNRLQQNYGPLVCDINDETFLNGAEHFDSCNRQARTGLANRAASPGVPFGGLIKVNAGDVLQHKPITDKPLYFGASKSIFQSCEQMTGYGNLRKASAGISAYKQFNEVISPNCPPPVRA